MDLPRCLFYDSVELALLVEVLNMRQCAECHKDLFEGSVVFEYTRGRMFSSSVHVIESLYVLCEECDDTTNLATLSRTQIGEIVHKTIDAVLKKQKEITKLVKQEE